MNPGSTFERVYRALKAELLLGHYRPGEPLEPRHLGDRHYASVTPIRDALHRLAGERLVQVSRHDGFRVPNVTEAGLRDLRRWQHSLSILSITLAQGQSRALPPELGLDIAERTGRLYSAIAALAKSAELEFAMDNANERLDPVRRVEARFLPGLAEELAALEDALFDGRWRDLRRLLDRYRRMRDRATPAIVAALTAPARA